MNSEVYWNLELEIQEGRENDFQDLMPEMIAATNADEPGALNYEWSVSADGRHCHIYERFADSAAAMTHLGNFGAKFAERFLQVFRPVRFVVYGAPGDDVREALAGFTPAYMDYAGGFRR